MTCELCQTEGCPADGCYETDAEIIAALRVCRARLHGQVERLAAEGREMAIKARDDRSAARDADRWIPVTERLPEDGTKVLFAADDWSESGWEPKDVRFGNIYRGSWWQDGCKDRVKNVRVWRPLPSPPKEAGHGE